MPQPTALTDITNTASARTAPVAEKSAEPVGEQLAAPQNTGTRAKQSISLAPEGLEATTVDPECATATAGSSKVAPTHMRMLCAIAFHGTLSH